ncbi:response regulator [uncultured Turicimonas sp.]|uniref:response regulator transcription factor n=1 Tax=uncultured Turicimonas sp. TaxID=1918607 RepID=UPI002805A1BD|nr:response regulator [uncultured Turicimonas sp.]
MANLTPLVRIVDDDPTICDSQSFFLQLAGWQTVTYQDPVTFLERDDWDRPGCIILDVRMPSLSGLEVQQELNKRGVDLPIIFLSAHGDIEMAMNCVEQGAFNFLVKPPIPEKLKDLVEKAIKLNKSQRKIKKETEELQKLFNQLTSTEQMVARQVAKGLTNKTIGEVLDMSERTVQSHRSKVFAKLDVGNAVELFQFLTDMENSSSL